MSPHQEPGASATHLPTLTSLPCQPALSVCLTSHKGTKPSVHSETLLFPPQMESVGVYGFCGCKGKSKVKCDSRWEIAAAGRT